MRTIFKVFIEFVTILLLFCVLTFWLQGMWDLSSSTRNQTCTPCVERPVLTISLLEVFLNYKHLERKLFCFYIHYPLPQSMWGYEAFSILVVSLSICENRLKVSNFLLLVRYNPRNIYNLRTLYLFFILLSLLISIGLQMTGYTYLSRTISRLTKIFVIQNNFSIPLNWF